MDSIAVWSKTVVSDWRYALAFIRDWAADWKGVDMKVAISQSIFANLSTIPDTVLIDAHSPRLQPLPRGVIPKDYLKAKDMDSNGWPQTGRNKAIDAMRKCYAIHFAGDQHLATIFHHGIDEFREWHELGIVPRTGADRLQ